MPGAASSVLTSSAKTPPMRKNRNELMTYMIPIFLWSVVVNHA
jgi:hypothetical protein